MANPGRRVLTGTELGIVVGSGQEAVTAAMQVAYSRPPPLEEASDMAEEAKTRFEVRLWALEVRLVIRLVVRLVRLGLWALVPRGGFLGPHACCSSVVRFKPNQSAKPAAVITATEVALPHVIFHWRHLLCLRKQRCPVKCANSLISAL